ncbi:MAG: hypothetical protein ACREAC_04810, partial [Blastocatellia bacterium]
METHSDKLGGWRCLRPHPRALGRACRIAVITTLLVSVVNAFGLTGFAATRKPGGASIGGSGQSRRAKPAPDTLVEYQRLLISIPLTTKALAGFQSECSDADTEVPMPVRELMPSLKHQLRDLIALTLESDPGIGPAEFKAKVLSELASIAITVGETESEKADYRSDACRFGYGAIHDIEVAQPNDDRDLIAVTTSLGVVCGEDTSLYLFERRRNVWKLVISR